VFLAPIDAPPHDLAPLLEGTCSLDEGLRRLLAASSSR
jgi:hypothetical protein